jgi:hypothetical protein
MFTVKSYCMLDISFTKNISAHKIFWSCQQLPISLNMEKLIKLIIHGLMNKLKKIH